VETVQKQKAAELREAELPEVSINDECILVAALAFIVSVFTFAWFFRRGDILLYGDAVAHINIARRLFDARNPGWDQLGSVWLPLPHLLMAPFVANDWLWRTGIGGSVPSMLAYVLGVAGIYRLVRARASRAGAALAAIIYALNPSLLYMQSTAMTESIFLAALIWSVVYFDDFVRGLGESGNASLPARAPAAGSAALPDSIPPAGAQLPSWKAIERCGCCLAAAIFTRYDGWIFAFVVGICAVLAALRWFTKHPPQPTRARLLRSMLSFLLLLALCPTLWLAHNYKINRHPLDWLNGPYSAKAIERRSSPTGYPPYPGKGNVKVAAQYFLKAARMNTGEGSREDWLIALASCGVLIALFRPRRFGALLLLWIPLPFYAYSIAYGSVPIFVPAWWPFSYYNVRYGLELLPAIAAFVGLLPWAIEAFGNRGNATLPAAGARRRELTLGITGALLVVTLLAYSSSVWCFSRYSQGRDVSGNPGRRGMIPICYREAWANSRTRISLEQQIAEALMEIPPDATVLMYTSDYVGALQQAGIHLDRVISECTLLYWDSARSAPFAGADYIVAIDRDPVAEAVRINPRGLTKVAILHTMGKPDVTIYRGSRP
jgi:hypothetical protein